MENTLLLPQTTTSISRLQAEWKDKHCYFMQSIVNPVDWEGHEIEAIKSVIDSHIKSNPITSHRWHFTKTAMENGDIDYTASLRFGGYPIQAWNAHSLAAKIADFYIAIYTHNTTMTIKSRID